MNSLSLELAHALPEMILAVGAIVMVLVGAIRGKDDDGPMSELAVVALGAALVTILLGHREAGVVFNGAFIDDGFGDFMKALSLTGSIVVLLMAGDFLRGAGVNKFEFPILIVLATLGMLMLISANGLIALYLGLELMSLSLYVVAAISRDDARASEAGLKYFVLGALSSGMLLYGASLLYGFAGTVSFAGIASAIGGHPNTGVIFGLVFLFAGLAFKMSVVPFHMWTPDVYEGAPTPVTAFFASAPKMAAVAITVRVIMTAFPGAVAQWQQIIVFLALASMALGSFAAIVQTNIKRLMAYSSIGHMGFALVGLAAGTEAGARGVAIYMAIYLVMTLGTFAAILSMRVNGKPVEKIADLSGLSRTNPTMAFFLAMLMFSLAGVPPLAGFFAKFYVFMAAVEAKLYWLAVIGILTSAVSAYYYLRIVKIMYFDEPESAFDRPSMTQRAVLAVSSLAMLLFWIFPAPLVDAAAAAAHSLF
ncbi:NADH-quinone oxidoreductase subunit NuoN [Rhodoblastus acidophilus]|uniref:NADH-quinone oxidoreductase subunit N n=1 Tax=Candidatus Rhodoblastus alkanivorans TaxID=2954117 RepID=A0ABS9Z5D3_9HYPH|nr:NADH-quinone oxidoreductase subunit NuoN [Candidatus Rhodoblastus alkanivorans]MCI4678442.1 NADH-quinone oxidoreductase subunit NuoN [Candidatus Rhodoblastus alkanivorans]MCI4682885.1 NADH-quinone oxidoreductase subunit NuoN [Candidatus Rhodoblastus alkanivorans]MDI4640194.1 NADH-quinone oxidoreductase subunit NuoN [Rhodoblastus acidophilus]